MKRYIIQLSDDLSTIYEEIAKINQKPVEEALRMVLTRVIETMLEKNSKAMSDDSCLNCLEKE